MGATIYFDNMSSEETEDLLKTLNRHKVGLKLQNKDKSPCRSPMGTLSWEGKTRFGGSSPDIILVRIPQFGQISSEAKPHLCTSNSIY